MFGLIERQKKQESKKEDMMRIPIDLIVPNKDQPRKLFDDEALNELTESVKTYGILQPLIVRKEESKEECEYLLIAGERRYRAAKKAGLTEVPCIILDAEEQNVALIALVENIQRQDLNFFEEAQAIYILAREYGLSQAMLAEKLGKSQSTIANKLRLLKLPEEIRTLITNNDITERHARALLQIDDDESKLKILGKIIEKRLNVAQSEQLIDEFLAKKYAQENPKKGKRIMIVRDVRLFTNTINNAIGVMRSSGIEALAEKTESNEYIEYKIRIRKAI